MHQVMAASALGSRNILPLLPVFQGDRCPAVCVVRSCDDAQTACNTVQQNPINLGLDKTQLQIGGFGSAQVWLTRKASSKTTDNANALCNQIVASCCPSGGFGQKSTIALQAGEQGSVQIIPAN